MPTAELAISQQEHTPRFSILLLQITATDAFPITTRLASALYFKNYIKRNWTVLQRQLPRQQNADEESRTKMGSTSCRPKMSVPLSRS